MPPAAERTTRARASRRAGRGAEIALDRAADVGEQRVELGVGAGGVGELQALLELVDVQPAVAGGATERQDRALAVGVGGAQVGQRRLRRDRRHDPEVKQPRRLS